MSAPRYEITWHVSFRFPLPEQRDTWYRGPDGAAALLAALRGTSLWPMFDVVGRDHDAGEPLDLSPAGLAALERQLAEVKGVTTFARGPAQAAMFLEEAELGARLTVRSDALELQAPASGAALDRLGPAFLDEIIELIAGFYGRWHGKIQIAHAVAVPGGLSYPRPRPPRRARRFVAAIVDVLAPSAPRPEEPLPGFDFVGEAQRLAATPLPARDAALPHVERQARGELLVDRWVRDPSDRAEVSAAAGRHERWLVPLVETTIVPGWDPSTPGNWLNDD
jgi:hypothetical protein